MKSKHLFLFSTCLFVNVSVFASVSIPKDSVGVERKGKSTLVLHKVESGETLFSLARRYHSSVNTIKSENPGMKDALRSGEIIKIPYTGSVAVNTSTTPVTTSALKDNDVIINGKKHTVANGEGLYSIARKYKVTVDNLRKWNHLSSDELHIGQELVVGNGEASEKAEKAAIIAASTEEKAPLPAGGKKHTVANGEGLYSIARKYKVTVDNLRDWNDLRSDNIDIGQELVVSLPENAQAATTVAHTETKPHETVKTTIIEKVPEKKTTAPIVSTTTPAPVTNTVAVTTPVSTESKPVTIDPTATAMATPASTGKSVDSIGNKEEEKAAEKATPLVINNSGYVKTVETGMAEAITDGASSDLFLALHRTAPVGTIMQVRNEMNDQSVFVKVVGKLPDTGDNDKVIVKLSKKAYERLAAVDKRFRVQVSYMPQ
ncbi:LysM peptidoglycan-binding domain-containing protein [Xanthocytophaga agilis]|uniref:LysM peptidoglycan-binding domain-containing protein n=1 Tax=Xanthocytophaga agilis TaxID=3048010 RepID=A0AAE3R6U2_9BACT|nr:LysM peptidoglycan-binding domain-containing protein [Xanthocytophaga agilis]MDJ1504809.1 LysM peptidoglycan-binding domain-containing protein [Xanthocytophaga agilis]